MQSREVKLELAANAFLASMASQGGGSVLQIKTVTVWHENGVLKSVSVNGMQWTFDFMTAMRAALFAVSQTEATHD